MDIREGYQVSKFVLQKVRSNCWPNVLITLKEQSKEMDPVLHVLNSKI